MKITTYKELVVWQKAMDLVINIYAITEKFPKSEIYSLTSQMRRCAVSIPSNIAEGRRRQTKADYRHFLIIAYGSGAELETQIEIAKRLKFIIDEESTIIDCLLLEIMKMLNIMIEKLV